MKEKIRKLEKKGVIIPCPNNIEIGDEVKEENIEEGVILNPGIVIKGSKTLIGKGSKLGPGGYFYNFRCGRNVEVYNGFYSECVLLDEARTRWGSEIRKGCLFMEKSDIAHTVGCKMTILGIKVTLGSLINFCDIYVTGGTNYPFDFTEIGSGAIHYNFTPTGLKFGSLIGPGVSGEFFGIFPKSFIGGQTKIIAPTIIGSNVLIPAGVSVREDIEDGTFYISSPLKSKKGKFFPNLLTNVLQKVCITFILVTHLKLLKYFYGKYRKCFAILKKDKFLEKLLKEAEEIIDLNIKERIGWIFNKIEEGTDVSLYSKLSPSLKIHYSNLTQNTKFYLNQIKEHKILLEKRKNIYNLFNKDIKEYFHNNLEEKELFLEWEKDIKNYKGKNYFEFISNFPIQLKIKGKDIFERIIQEQLKEFENIIINNKIEFEIKIENIEKITLKYIKILKELYKKKILISTEGLKNLDIINFNINFLSNISEIGYKLFGNIELTEENLQIIDKIFNLLLTIEFPVLINWKNLLNSALINKKVDNIILSNSFERIHGTDGVRGTVYIPNKEISKLDAIKEYINNFRITPQLIKLLAYSTILGFKYYYKEKPIIGIGKDTRDIFKDNPLKEDILYSYLKEGTLLTNYKFYDFNIAPVPFVPYLMDYYNINPNLANINIFLYKTASHNPSSQDGIKTFIKVDNKYLKLDKKLEYIITALLCIEAIKTDKNININENLSEITSNHIIVPDNLKEKIFKDYVDRNLNFKLDKLDLLVCDLANGSFSVSPYVDILYEKLKELNIKEIKFIGNKPNGKNINNNLGKEKVGASHFENIYNIEEKDVIKENGSFYGFPALSYFYYNYEKIKNNKGLNGVLFTDGDGDRIYLGIFQPNSKKFYIIDGDKSLFINTVYRLKKGLIKLGDSINFTVESSSNFINGITNYIKKNGYKINLILSSQQKDANSINLKITPVGDKYLLKEWEIGAESTGHLILPYFSEKNQIFIGNGVFGGLNIIKNLLYLKDNNKLEDILFYYSNPIFISIYIYYINKSLFFKNSNIWFSVENKIYKSFENEYILKKIEFLEENNTLYIIGFQKNNPDIIEFTILVRPSGTENKFGLKFYCSPSIKDKILSLCDEFYIDLSLKLKNFNLKENLISIDILKILNQNTSFEINEFYKKYFKKHIYFSYFIPIINALKKENLIYYNGEKIKISERGEKYLKKLSKD